MKKYLLLLFACNCFGASIPVSQEPEVSVPSTNDMLLISSYGPSKLTRQVAIKNIPFAVQASNIVAGGKLPPLDGVNLSNIVASVTNQMSISTNFGLYDSQRVADRGISYYGQQRYMWPRSLDTFATNGVFTLWTYGNGWNWDGEFESTITNLLSYKPFAGYGSLAAMLAPANYTYGWNSGLNVGDFQNGMDAFWLSTYFVLTNSNCVISPTFRIDPTFPLIAGATIFSNRVIKADIVKVIYMANPIGGLFNIDVRHNYGSDAPIDNDATWTTIATNVSSTNATYVTKIFWWTNTSPQFTQVRIKGTSAGWTPILDVGQWNSQITNGVILGQLAHNSGPDLTQYTNFTSRMYPALNSCKPTMVIYAGGVGDNNDTTWLPNFFNYLKDGYTNADIIDVGVHFTPDEHGNINEAKICFANHIPFFDGRSVCLDTWGSYEHAQSLGLYDTNNLPHLLGPGYNSFGEFVWEWLDFRQYHTATPYQLLGQSGGSLFHPSGYGWEVGSPGGLTLQGFPPTFGPGAFQPIGFNTTNIDSAIIANILGTLFIRAGTNNIIRLQDQAGTPFAMFSNGPSGNMVVITNAYTSNKFSIDAGANIETSGHMKASLLSGKLDTDAVNISNVKYWGAKGDGVTDDTVAINAALTYANSIGGGSVLVPAGTYAVSNVVTVYSNCKLYGSGTLLQSGTDFTYLTGEFLPAPENTSVSGIVYVKSNAVNVTIDGISVTGNWNTNVAGTVLHGILVGKDTTNCTVMNTKVVGGGWSGILLRGKGHTAQNNLVATNCIDGIECWGSNLRIINNYSVWNGRSALGAIGYGGGVEVTSTGSDVVSNVTVIGHQSLADRFGIISTGGNVDSMTVKGCNVSMALNRSINIGGNGFHTNVIIVGNIVKKGDVAAGANDGICLNTNVYQFIIADNIIDSDVGLSSGPSGIGVYQNCANGIINNNSCSSYWVGMTVSGTGTNIVVANNVLTSNRGLNLSPANIAAGYYFNHENAVANDFVTGPVAITNRLNTFNGGYYLSTNMHPAKAGSPGGAFLWNSNATVYILTSTANSTTWAATNKIAGP